MYNSIFYDIYLAMIMDMFISMDINGLMTMVVNVLYLWQKNKAIHCMITYVSKTNTSSSFSNTDKLSAKWIFFALTLVIENSIFKKMNFFLFIVIT